MRWCKSISEVKCKETRFCHCVPKVTIKSEYLYRYTQASWNIQIKVSKSAIKEVQYSSFNSFFLWNLIFTIEIFRDKKKQLYL